MRLAVEAEVAALRCTREFIGNCSSPGSTFLNEHYHHDLTHLALEKDTPISRVS
jgi:hypothetical protein